MFQYLARVIEVIDGDTVDAEIDLGFSICHKIRIRLHGINTPESRTRNKEEKAKGLAAKARLKELVEGKLVVVETQRDDTEKFGRYLAVLHIDNINVNKQLIVEGHAKEYHGEKR
jgi:micrococcal nuclease